MTAHLVQILILPPVHEPGFNTFVEICWKERRSKAALDFHPIYVPMEMYKYKRAKITRVRITSDPKFTYLASFIGLLISKGYTAILITANCDQVTIALA